MNTKQLTEQRQDLDGMTIELRHEIDESRLEPITEMMSEEGWVGRPVVVYRTLAGQIRNITGCHRIQAAIDTDTPVPVLVLVPTDIEAEDALEFAAANDDIDAAYIVRRYSTAAAELIEQG